MIVFAILIAAVRLQAQQDPIIQLRPGDRSRNAIAGKGSIGDRPASMGGAIERPPSANERPIRPPTRPLSSQSNPGAPSAPPFGLSPSETPSGALSGSGKTLDQRLTSLGSTRGSEDLNLFQGDRMISQGDRSTGLGGPFQDPRRDGQRPFGMGAGDGSTESLLRDIWARPVAPQPSQSQAPGGMGPISAAQDGAPRPSIASDFRAAMGVNRREPGPFGAPFDAGQLLKSSSSLS